MPSFDEDWLGGAERAFRQIAKERESFGNPPPTAKYATRLRTDADREREERGEYKRGEDQRGDN